MRAIDTYKRDAFYRRHVVDVAAQSVLVSRLAGSAQEPDLSAPTNCGGFGRIRHFRRAGPPGWPENPLPIMPACRWLGMAAPDVLEAQVFQLAACAWRCWYCFVPYPLMTADPTTSAWRSADDLVDAYMALPNRPRVLDLSGGSPDLAPEWISWTLDAVKARGATPTTYVWSDDNLSSDRLLWRENAGLLRRLESAGNYGKACCLKGLDAASFAYNTRASAEGFEEQLRILTAYAGTRLDIHVYLPLVGPAVAKPSAAVASLLDRLASIRPDLPSRTVPLFVSSFGAMERRLDDEMKAALRRQWELVAHWPAPDAPIEARP